MVIEECSTCQRCCRAIKADPPGGPYRVKQYGCDVKAGVGQPVFITAMGQSRCANLGEDGCVIPYEKRGIVCRAFPFFPLYVMQESCVGISLKCPEGARILQSLAKSDPKAVALAHQMYDMLNDSLTATEWVIWSNLMTTGHHTLALYRVEKEATCVYW